jgi:hypothetical protein
MGAKSERVKASNDRLRIIREVAKHGRNMAAFHRTSFAERYVQGWGYIAIRNRSIGPEQHGFLIKAAPPSGVCFGGKEPRNHGPSSDCGHVQEASMFPGQIEIMDGAEHIVPSGIWREIFDGDLIVGGKPLYLFEHSLVLAGSKIVKAFPDGEIGIRGIGKTISGSKCAGEQIETASDAVNYGSSSRVLDGIEGADFRESVKFFAGLRIGVYSDGVWLTEGPNVDAFRQNWDLGFGPIDSSSCI